MHAWCNASYDLVPAWVNPAPTVFSILTLVALNRTGFDAGKDGDDDV